MCSDPLVAAVVLGVLLAEPLFYEREDLVHRLCGHIEKFHLFSEFSEVACRMVQPFHEFVRQVAFELDVLKVLEECLVEFIVV